MSERDKLYRLLLRLSGNAQDAEDLLQETFLTVWRKRASFEGRGAPEGFLRTTAVRLCLNSHTRSNRRPTSRSTEAVDERRLGADPNLPCPAKKMEQRDAEAFLVARVREELADLPAAAREAFLLFRFEGLSCAEIARLTNEPTKTVQTRLRRATLALAEKLEPLRDLFLAS